MRPSSRAVRGILCAGAAACAIGSGPAVASAASGAPHLAGAQRASAAPAAAVPAGFKASAMTWTSASDGWVLGAKSCGLRHNCKGSQVIGTTDAGKTWHLVGTVAATIPKLGLGGNGITEIRMATSSVGWAFAPALFRTANGGRTWRKMTIPGGGKQVLSLAVTGTAAYAIVSQCGYEKGLCNGPLTAWRTSLTSTTWTHMSMPRPLHANVAASVAAFGSTVYVVNDRVENSLKTQLFASTDGGAHFSARGNPCTSAEEFSLFEATPYSATKVGLLCDGNPGFSKAVKAVYLSGNTGRTDSYAGTMSLFGGSSGLTSAQLAISASGNLAVASWSDGSFIDINDTHGTTWHQVIGSGDGGAGFNDITYVSNKVAWVVGAPASMFADFGVLFKTTDAGRHWKMLTP
jgi:photosystem II stability/assembly factor-like uncharacterized protein